MTGIAGSTKISRNPQDFPEEHSFSSEKSEGSSKYLHRFMEWHVFIFHTLARNRRLFTRYVITGSPWGYRERLYPRTSTGTVTLPSRRLKAYRVPGIDTRILWRCDIGNLWSAGPMPRKPKSQCHRRKIGRCRHAR